MTPTHVLAHLSDTHLLADGHLLAGRIDTVALLRQALARIEASGEAIDAIVLSGDLTDTGDPAAYELLVELVTPVADRLGAGVVLTGGNHDERRPLAWALHGLDTDEPCDRAVEVRGLRILAIDSAVPGYHHGGFADAQYAWLEQQLATPAPDGTILVMHHPPLTYRSPTMQLLDFDDVDRLRRTLVGTDVRAVLCGHLHVTTFGMLGDIPVLVAGGVSYVDDAGAPRERLMGIDGPQSWNLIDVHPHGIVSTVVPVAEHPTWPALSDAVRDHLDSVPEADRREAFSRKLS